MSSGSRGASSLTTGWPPLETFPRLDTLLPIRSDSIKASAHILACLRATREPKRGAWAVVVMSVRNSHQVSPAALPSSGAPSMTKLPSLSVPRPKIDPPEVVENLEVTKKVS